MVFIGDIFIGGFDELNTLARQGNLEALLTAAAEATTGP
jgi:soluble cytochrome b562